MLILRSRTCTAPYLIILGIENIQLRIFKAAGERSHILLMSFFALGL
jgi:hypothetical protein